MNDMWLYIGSMLVSVLIASIAQLLLKKAALRNYSPWYRQYLNLPVIGAYCILLASTVFGMFAYRRLPLSSTPAWQALEQVFVVVISLLFLGEKPNRRKLIGTGLIALGIILFIL